MLKKFAIFAACVAVCTMVALAYVTARFVDKKEILRAENELKELRQDREALQAKVAELSEKQKQLNSQIESQTTEIAGNKATIARLKDEQAAQQLNVRMLNTSDAQLQSFLKAFPEVAKAKNVGVTKMVVNEELKLTVDYLALPLTFSETFVIEHEAKQKLEAQLEKYKQNEALYGSVIELKDQVLQLEEAKSSAYQEGYDKAFGLYEDVNQKYVALLEKPPKVEFKAPNTWLMLGCSAVGVALGASL